MAKNKQHTLIIGGSKGLGKVVARTLTRRGDFVTVTGIEKKSFVLNNSDYVQMDLFDKKQVKEQLAAIIKKRGRLSTLVLMQRYRGDGDSWDNELEIILNSSRQIIEQLKNSFTASGSKSIVIIGSVTAHFIALDQQAGYHAAKAALSQLARYYAVALGKKKIRCNVISPTIFVKQESRKYYSTPSAFLRKIKKYTPLGRVAEAGDIASLIDFLSSPGSSFITGQDILIDGGLFSLAHFSILKD